ncbi:adenosylcobinamide amidohydrolase [Sporomusa acidovorans]|uniref:Adenosylcobinamide amidohydrolase n=1 Tax=Sporomusa acidovorans (strain ATCC 49682 / DSM 3132 / Mol) TaxID=1123286 RepID=A0ABZ3IYS0_SPOA4|nr:adenosylcobinamide amidohydrolase [Sporomusa acidovorans]OZC17657.1 adenosylcobinamide amidohydrolase [Sporomusa acidovorans DSM 3132]SDE11209.1 Adenosylcobinamide amidohydrolase [Sporomusa acidovorans]
MNLWIQGREQALKLCTLATGDSVYRYYKSIVIPFEQPRKVSSTAVVNGGYREDLTAVFNNDCNPGAGMACTMRAPTYQEHMRLIAEEIGLDPATTAGMGTAASMENVAIYTECYENLTVTAIVTGGVEVNGGRVGDPTDYFQPIDKSAVEKPGTINIMLVIDADLPPGILNRAMVTCTEAKTAALQELMVGSHYSTGLATGSGTDQTIVIANPASSLYLESAGKHSKLGELIGRTVLPAVKEALCKQTKLSPRQQHSMLRRFKRYGIVEESLWQAYAGGNAKAVSKPKFMDVLYQVDRDGYVVTYAALYIHLLDEFQWKLLSAVEVRQAGNELLRAAAGKFGVEAPVIAEASVEACLKFWTILLINILRAKCREANGELSEGEA